MYLYIIKSMQKKYATVHSICLNIGLNFTSHVSMQIILEICYRSQGSMSVTNI